MITNVKLEGDFVVFEINNDESIRIRLRKDMITTRKDSIVRYKTGSYTITTIHDRPDDISDWNLYIEISNKDMNFEDAFANEEIQNELGDVVRNYLYLANR
jgi:hypothetical protein